MGSETATLDEDLRSLAYQQAKENTDALHNTTVLSVNVNITSDRH